MNRADRLYEVLKDGHRKTRQMIFHEAGSYFMTNNAAAELRAQLRSAGLDVEMSYWGTNVAYQLVPLREADAGGVSASRSGPSTATRTDSRESSSLEHAHRDGPSPGSGAELSPEGAAPEQLSFEEAA